MPAQAGIRASAGVVLPRFFLTPAFAGVTKVGNWYVSDSGHKIPSLVFSKNWLCFVFFVCLVFFPLFYFTFLEFLGFRVDVVTSAFGSVYWIFLSVIPAFFLSWHLKKKILKAGRVEWDDLQELIIVIAIVMGLLCLFLGGLVVALGAMVLSAMVLSLAYVPVWWLGKSK